MSRVNIWSHVAGIHINLLEDAAKGSPTTLRLDLRIHDRQAPVIGEQTPPSSAQVPLRKHRVPGLTS